MNIPRRFLWSYPLLGVLGMAGVVALRDTGTRSSTGFVAALVLAVAVGLGLGINAVRPVDAEAEAPPLRGGLLVGAALVPVGVAVNRQVDSDVVLWVAALASVAAGAGFVGGLAVRAVAKARHRERHP